MAGDQPTLPPVGETLRLCLEQANMSPADLSHCLPAERFATALDDRPAEFTQSLPATASAHGRMVLVIEQCIATNMWKLKPEYLPELLSCCIDCFTPQGVNRELLDTLALNFACVVAELYGAADAMPFRRYRPPGS